MLRIQEKSPVAYPAAVAAMEERVEGIRRGTADEALWLLEHPPLYTAGTSAKAEDLLSPRFPVYQTGRGGQYTYHGPGQRVAYVMLDLKKRQKEPDIRDYVRRLEEWLIQSLAVWDIQGERREGRVGIWVRRGDTEAKIAAVGVRVRHWVTYHGVSLNINPDLSHFNGIVPCGIKEYGVTRISDFHPGVSTAEVDAVLEKIFPTIFPDSAESG